MQLLQPETIRTPMLGLGYRPDLLKSAFRFGLDQIAPLVGFAQAPADSRSACIAVTESFADPRASVEACRSLGAPVVFVCHDNHLQWWKQGAQSALYLDKIPAGNIDRFFAVKKSELSPDVVYRAKTWGRFKAEFQLSFVDLGLMPLLEQEVGKSLEGLIERNVSDLRENLGLTEISESKGHWLLQTIFWLLSGKILHDKSVRNFESLDLTDVEEIFSRLGSHYGANPLPVKNQAERAALLHAAHSINQFASLALTTTEALAYVYENTLISKQTRTQLGTHSTPSFLVDYIVGSLADSIKEIPVEERSVFEPACGHAAFLVSAMRLLTELLPSDRALPQKRGPYLRKRLHGTDIDPFALELARLSLTLTDIPNPNGWDLEARDMFIGENIREQAAKSTILLANPPFENFTPQNRSLYLEKSSPVRFNNKAAELLWRTIPNLPAGGVFGVVLPQSILDNENAAEVRKMLTKDFDLDEVCLFPDQVFSFSQVESVVLMGRRKRNLGNAVTRYRRVREQDWPAFRTTFEASNTKLIPQINLENNAENSLRVPDLQDIWESLGSCPLLEDVASTGQGLSYKGLPNLAGAVTFANQPFKNAIQGFVHFDSDVMLTGLPHPVWMTLDPTAILAPRSGTAVGTPQVILNYARCSRGPWRLKALLDSKGHPLSSRYIAVRSKSNSYPVEAIWAILNSPIANAFAFTHLEGRRDNLVGELRRLPFPKPNQSLKALVALAIRYLKADTIDSHPEKLRELLFDIDEEVLRLYGLSPQHERELLDLFSGTDRLGVPFLQNSYFPMAFRGRATFREFRELDRSWEKTNRERGLLIAKDVSGKIDQEESIRLALLQEYAEFHLATTAPRPMDALDEFERMLAKRHRERREH